MTAVLVLGGTGWLSGHVARRWVAAGADVTCLARGGRPAPDGAELVLADRDAPDAYAAVAEREWDEIVDISSQAAHVASAVGALAARTQHWTYVSSLSVYTDETTIGADESAPTAAPAEPGDEYDYAREKVAAETAVRTGLGGRAAVVRPGLIVGPGDPSDRVGYWVGRFARDRRGDVANATGDPMPFTDLAALARAEAGHSGILVPESDEWLTAHGVAHWMGPRSLPLWLPADMPGFSTRSNAAYRAAGGTLRPLRDTLSRTLADERDRGLDRARRSGLSRAEELELIQS